jgi:hypothetical protein
MLGPAPQAGTQGASLLHRRAQGSKRADAPHASAPHDHTHAPHVYHACLHFDQAQTQTKTALMWLKQRRLHVIKLMSPSGLLRASAGLEDHQPHLIARRGREKKTSQDGRGSGPGDAFLTAFLRRTPSAPQPHARVGKCCRVGKCWRTHCTRTCWQVQAHTLIAHSDSPAADAMQTSMGQQGCMPRRQQPQLRPFVVVEPRAGCRAPRARECLHGGTMPSRMTRPACARKDAPSDYCGLRLYREVVAA